MRRLEKTIDELRQIHILSYVFDAAVVVYDKGVIALLVPSAHFNRTNGKPECRLGQCACFNLLDELLRLRCSVREIFLSQ